MKQQLTRKILELKRTYVKKLVNDRIKEFQKLKKQPKKWFLELCYCILTANSTAERCIDVQKKIGNGFLNFPLFKLKQKMKQASCRFYNKRARYIVEAREKFNAQKMKQLADKNLEEAREWLVQNIKGMGMKEASHFLRNVGYDIAIVDFHILDILKKYKIISKNTILNKKNYTIIEDKLENIAGKTKSSLSELDLYLWYMETGKVLK